MPFLFLCTLKEECRKCPQKAQQEIAMGVDNRGATEFSFFYVATHRLSTSQLQVFSKDENWKLKGQGLSLDLIIFYARSFSSLRSNFSVRAL